MAELGFNVLDAAGNLRDMGQVIEEIGYKWQDLTREQQVSLAQTMAGQRQYSNLIALFDNFDKYTEALNTAQNAAGTLNEQQSIYLESTAAHLTQLKTATENLYDSLINPDSLEPLIDVLTTATSLMAKFVDSLGGGQAVLASLGGVAANVFSKQITNGITTFIQNLHIASSNIDDIEQRISFLNNVGSLQGLNSQTQSLINQSSEFYKNFAGSATAEQYTQMRQKIDELTQATNDYKRALGEAKQLDAVVLAVQKGNKQFTSFTQILKLNQDQHEKFIEKLRNQQDAYDTVSTKTQQLIEKLQQLRRVERDGGETEQTKNDRITLIDNQITALEKLKQAQFVGDGFKSERQDIDALVVQLNKLKNEGLNQADFDQKINEISNKFQRMGEESADNIDKIQQGVEKLGDTLPELARRADQAGSSTKQFLDNLKTEQGQQAVGKLIGSFTQLGASVNQVRNIGKIINNEDLSTTEKWGQSITNAASSLTMMIPAAISAGKAIHTLNTAISAATGGWIALAATAVLAIGSAVIQHIKAQNEALIEQKEVLIDAENQKQAQIESNKKLYSSIEDLNEQYKAGEITRIQLRSSIEDLCDQYGIESSTIQGLTTDYDNLTEAIKRRRIVDAEAGIKSATKELNESKELIVQQARSGIGRKDINGNYNLYFGGGIIGDGFAIQQQSDAKVAEYLKEIGFKAGGWSGYEINVDFSYDSIVDLYEQVSAVIQKIRNDSSISDLEKSSSEIYQNMLKWQKQMQPSIEKNRQAQQDLVKYQTQLNILHTTELDQIENANDYLEQRKNIVDAIQQVLDKNNDKTSNATDMADAYLRDNYRKLYVQFDETAQYIQQLREKIGSTDERVERMLTDMDPQHFGKLVDIVNLNNVKDWGYLADKIQEISKFDLTNVEALVGQGGISSLNEAAADRYTFLQSLEDQIKGGKSISSTQFKRIGQYAPQLQQYFDMLANGQYKVTENVQDFYNTVDSLKLDGFRSSIQQINNEIERTQRLSQTSFDTEALKDYAYNIEQTRGTRQLGGNRILTDDNGQSANIAPKITRNIEINEQLASQQLQYLKTARAKDQEFLARLEDWETTIFESADLEQRKNAVIELGNATNEELNKTVYSSEELLQKEKETYQAMYDAMFPTDIDINESELFGLTQLIKDIAKQDNEFADSLDKDARSAEAVAESILRFNNAIEDMVKNYETWHGVLTNENVTIQQLAQVMQPLRDAYADLLDLDGSSLSSEFLQSAANLQLMKAAIDGNIESYDQLRQLAAQDIIAHLTFDTETARSDFMTEFSSISQWIQDHNIQFKIGASFDEQKYADLLGSLTNLINATQMTAAQASDLLHNAFGIDAEVVQETKTEKVKRTITGYSYDIDSDRVYGTDPFTRERFPYLVPHATPIIEKAEVTQEIPATGSALKIINARKTSGGNIKWKHSAQGAGNAGVVRRTKEAEKAAKAAPKPDTSTKEPTKYAKDDRDIYHDVNIEIQDIGRELARVQKQGNKLAGADLIKNLNKQLQILTKQKVKIQQKNELQKLDLQRQKQQLSLLGVTFDEYGHINNYLDVMGNRIGIVNGYIEAENAIISQYNATTDKEAKDAINQRLTEVQRQRKDAEDAKKDLESAIKDYDGMMNKIEDLADQVVDITQQKIQIQISKFKMKVELTLDMRSLQQDYNEFVRNVINADDLFRTSSGDKLYKNAEKSLADYQSYYNVANENSIAILTQQIAKARRLYEETGNSEYLDAMKSYISQLESSMSNMKKIEQDIQQIYLDTVDDIDAQADRQVEQYEYLEEQLQHDIDLVELVYGQHQYDAMQSYYNQLRVNHQNELSFLKSYADQLLKSREKAILDDQPELAEKYLKLWEETNSKIKAELKESIEDTKNEYLNAIDKIYYELELKLSNNKGFDYLSMQWELVNKNADQYLDTVNSVYAVQELERNFRNAIDENKNVKAQRALTDLMNQQLDYLKSKDKLTQYDVDRAEKLLQIQQARYALEDSRAAKTSLRLKRDSQGNYSYVYTASEDQVNDAQEKLAKLQNELYNFDKEAYQDNLDDVLAATKEYLDKRKDLQIQYNYADEEQKARLAEQLKLLDDNYYQYLEDKATENSVIRKNLQSSVAQECENLYTNNQQLFEVMTKGNYTNFEEMSDSIKAKLIDDLVPGYQGGIQDMINVFYGTGGNGDLTSFRGTCLEAWRQVDEATNSYEDAVSSLEQKAGTHLDNIKKGVDDVAFAYSQLIPKNKAVLDGFVEQQKEIDLLLMNLDELKKKNQEIWDAAVIEIGEATKALKDYDKEAMDALDIPSPPDNNYNGTPNLPSQPQPVAPQPTWEPPQNMTTQTTSQELKTVVTEPPKEEKTQTKNIGATPKSIQEGLAGAIYFGLWGSKFKESINDYMVDIFGINKGTSNFQKAWAIYSQPKYRPVPFISSSYYEYGYDYYKKKYKNKRNIDTGDNSLDTGGYTGAWGPEGRLAWLHQKQLVLNADDTKNMLDSVSILRGIVENIGGNISSRLSSLNSGASSFNNKSSDALEQNVHIQASFPNVNSKREIEEAFNDLVNLAAQRAMKR